MSLLLDRVTEKTADLCMPLLSRAPILGSLYMADRRALGASLSSGADLLMFTTDGLQTAGLASVKISAAHSTAVADVYCTDDLHYCEAIALLEGKLRACGVRKLSVRNQIFSSTEFMKDLGYVAEVRLRQHIWVDGKYISITEYGKVL